MGALSNKCIVPYADQLFAGGTACAGGRSLQCRCLQIAKLILLRKQIQLALSCRRGLLQVSAEGVMPKASPDLWRGLFVAPRSTHLALKLS